MPWNDETGKSAGTARSLLSSVMSLSLGFSLTWIIARLQRSTTFYLGFREELTQSRIWFLPVDPAIGSVMERLENCRIEVTQYITTSGEMAYDVHQRGDVPLSTQIGLLELAKRSLIKYNLEDSPE